MVHSPHNEERFHIRGGDNQQFIELILHTHGLDRRWWAVRRCGSKWDMGRSGGGDGGWSRGAEFEQLEWQFEQFQ